MLTRLASLAFLAALLLLPSPGFAAQATTNTASGTVDNQSNTDLGDQDVQGKITYTVNTVFNIRTYDFGNNSAEVTLSAVNLYWDGSITNYVRIYITDGQGTNLETLWTSSSQADTIPVPQGTNTKTILRTSNPNTRGVLASRRMKYYAYTQTSSGGMMQSKTVNTSEF